MVGDVPKIVRHEAELVRMPLPNPWASQRTIKDKEESSNMETNGGIAVHKSSLMHPEAWDLSDSSHDLENFQHKLQQIMRKEDMKLEIGYVGTKRSHMRHPHSS